MRVIVTRPERDAQAWVQALVRYGLDAIALPLIGIHPVADPSALRSCWAQLGSYAAVMFVSGSAVEHFFAARRNHDPAFGAVAAAATRAWVTGPGSAAALLRCGLDAAAIDAPAPDSGQFDSEALWSVVGSRVLAGDRVLIVRGADHGQESAALATPGWGRDWLARQLQQAGAKVEFVVAYERCAPVLDTLLRAQARQAASDGSVWLLTSAQAVANLRSCLPHQDWAAARALATHARIAGAARAAGFGVVWESRPSVLDVVASIESNA